MFGVWQKEGGKF